MPKLYTIGHSTRTFEQLLDCLKAFEIELLIDVRMLPKSRRMPWFNSLALAKQLQNNKIKYLHLPALGGLRKTTKDSINLGWRNTSFRGFADYMQTPAFYEGLKRLNELITSQHVTIMCAEALPWRCHRSLIADAETIRHIQVLHIFNEKTVKEHSLTAFAKVDKSKRPMQITYPAEDINPSATQLKLDLN